MNDNVVYRSVSTITRDHGPLRTADVPGRTDPVSFGVHSEIAEHYGVDEDAFPPDTTTIDYLVAAAGG